MDIILSNITSMHWWFDMVFPVAIAALLPKIFRWLSSHAKSLSRSIRAKRLHRIKSIRHDSLLISYEMNRSSAFFVVFVLLAIGTVITLLFTPNQQPRTGSEASVFWLAPIPMFWAELAWLLKARLVRGTLKSRAKLRMASRHGTTGH